MFDVIRNNKKVAQAILALIALPFMFFGLESYMSGRVGRDVALVGDSKITSNEFDRSWGQFQQRMREIKGDDFNIAEVNTPEARMAVLSGLIDQRLLALETINGRMMPSGQALREAIEVIPTFHDETGKFSMQRYQEVLSRQGFDPQAFEAGLSRDLAQGYLIDTISRTEIVPTSVSERIYRFRNEERSVAEFLLVPSLYADKVEISPEAARKYYDDNQRAFEVPERVKVDYIELSTDALVNHSVVTEAELESWYKDNQNRFGEPEQRRASHILIEVKPDASDEEKAAAKAKAEAILTEAKQPGADFAELAKKNSQDPGSAGMGGDLGYFGKGAMVQPFNDAVFSMKEGDISDVVPTDFGFHIIKLTGIKPDRIRPFDEVRDEVERDVKREVKSKEATLKFAENASRFTDIVYDQSESLKPAEEQLAPLGIKIQSSGWLERKPQPEQRQALGVLGKEKMLEAIFSDDVIKDGRNTSAIELGLNTLVSARVTEHEEARTRPFDEVKDSVVELLKAQEEQKLAKQEGEAKLAQLKSGDDSLAWEETKKISYNGGRFYAPAALEAIFKADVKQLPAYLGVELPNNGGYGLYKITQVALPEKTNEMQQRMIESELEQLASQFGVAAYLTGLRQRYKIEINQKALLEEQR